MKKICPFTIKVVKNEKKKIIHMATHERLLCQLKLNSHMLIIELYLLSLPRWITKQQSFFTQ
jgi:hypothetical protein